MKHFVGLGAFATFGNPNGFQQRFYLGVPFPQTLDLNPTAIKLHPNSEIFVVKKDLSGGVYSLCFCIYTYAREFQSSRSGTFIGSCVVFENSTSKGIYIYECLRELHNDIIGNPANLNDNVLQVNQASDLEVNKPHTYETIKANKFTFTNKPQSINHQESILIAAPNLYDSELAGTVSDFFSAAVKEFSKIGTLYFTTNRSVIEYVESQGLIEIISLEQFREYKPPQKSSAKEPIESKFNEPRSVYQEPRPEGTIRTWTMDWPVSELSRRVEEHNKLATLYWELENKNKELISKENPRTYESPYNNNRTFRLISVSGNGKIKLSKANRRRLAGVGLLFFAALIIWAVYSSCNTTTEKTQSTRSTTPTPPINPVSPNTPKILSPLPNGELNSEDLRYLNSRLRIGMTASEVVDLAIKLNPGDIGRRYESQKEAFAQKLVELNKECFYGDNQTPRLNGFELRHVPICRGCE